MNGADFAPTGGSPLPAHLALADGALFEGFALTEGEALGEVVFNTSMFGYQEMLTDPSYRGQILVLTAPHVGNVGVNDEDAEGRRVWAQGLVVANLEVVPSNWRARESLPAYLQRWGVPFAWGFDTRALVLHLRQQGALPGALVCGGAATAQRARDLARQARGTDGCDLTGGVAAPTMSSWAEGAWRRRGPRGVALTAPVRVVVLDWGVKGSILRRLVDAGAEVLVAPPSLAAQEVLALQPAGVVLSNGPGDPAAVTGAVAIVRQLVGRLPLLGICLGHQLLGLSLGGRTYKLPFGHHGANHPVRHVDSGEVWITSQNHNYAVDADSLSAGVRVTMVNLTDGSVEGIVAEGLGAEGIQFHPEAGPGPHDALGVFTRFVARCREEGR